MHRLLFPEKRFVSLFQLTIVFLSQFTVSPVKIRDDINGSKQELWSEFRIFYIYLSDHTTPLLCSCILEDTRSTAEVLLRA